MKSLVISLLLFALLISVIIINAIYINEETLRLIDITTELHLLKGAELEGSLNHLESEWNNFKKVADISCAYTDVNKIDFTIKEMKMRAATNSPEEFEAARQTLIFLLNELSRLEKISCDGLI
jgi:hypothetical protein